MQTDHLPSCTFDPDKLIVRFEFTIPAQVRSITPLVDEVMGFIRQLSCAKGKEFEVELSLREALVNAIVHGSKLDPSKDVQVFVACDETRGILIIVRDSGPGFHPDHIPNPVVGQNIFESHGRGIYLINQLMDEVKFEKGGTEIRMHKRSAESKD